MAKILTKRCVCCGRGRDLFTCYDMRSGAPDGRTALCISCNGLDKEAIARIAVERALAEERSRVAALPRTCLNSAQKRERLLEFYRTVGGKRCTLCHFVKPLAAYEFYPRGVDGLKGHCRGCHELQRTLKRTGHASSWPMVRAALQESARLAETSNGEKPSE